MHKAGREKDLQAKAVQGGFVVPVGKKWKLGPPKLGKRKLRALQKGIKTTVREEKRQKREREETRKRELEEQEKQKEKEEAEKAESVATQDGQIEEKSSDPDVIFVKTEQGPSEKKEDVTNADPNGENATEGSANEMEVEDKNEKKEEKREDKKEGAELGEHTMTEEERLSKIAELEEKLKSLDDQKHKLFLLLKQVISVEEQKRSKQAKEEERLRLEEQQRRENARRLEQMKAASNQTKADEQSPSKPYSSIMYPGNRHGLSSPFGSVQQSGSKSPFHRKHRINEGGNPSNTGNPDRSPQHPSGAPSSPPSMPMHSQAMPRGRGPPPSSMYNPYGVVQTVPPFALPPDSGHYPQVPPVHIPGHLPMGPHGLPLGMLPAQLALQAQLSQHLGLHPFPPHMLGRPGPGLLPTPPNHSRGRGRGDRRRRGGGFW